MTAGLSRLLINKVKRGLTLCTGSTVANFSIGAGAISGHRIIMC